MLVLSPSPNAILQEQGDGNPANESFHMIITLQALTGSYMIKATLTGAKHKQMNPSHLDFLSHRVEKHRCLSQPFAEGVHLMAVSDKYRRGTAA